MAFNWSCPHCDTKTTINKDDYSTDDSMLRIENADGTKYLRVEWIVCPNTSCKKITLYALLHEYNFIPNIWQKGEFIKKWTLLPDTKSKVFPEYIPIALRRDYQEAYSILELSPKAAATLARRCIQGIIRDFWGINKARLVDEINALEDKIDPLTWKSIDAIRKVGNIGAHMEKDINLIIDVDAKEATLLVQLIEMLFIEWYVHRHEREIKLNAIVGIAKDKDELKKGN